jgi:hypothetical protein
MSKSLYRSELSTAKKKELLNKIKSMRVLVQKDSERYDSRTCEAFAIDEEAGSDNLVFTPPDTSSKAFAAIQGLLYTAKDAGSAGNDITVEYEDGGTAGSETVLVTGTAIVVTLEAGVSTAADVLAVLEAETDVTDIVDLAEIDGEQLQEVQAETNLSGGTDAAVEQSYDLADIRAIRRARTRKWVIELKSSANPA